MSVTLWVEPTPNSRVVRETRRHFLSLHTQLHAAAQTRFSVASVTLCISSNANIYPSRDQGR